MLQKDQNGNDGIRLQKIRVNVVIALPIEGKMNLVSQSQIGIRILIGRVSEKRMCSGYSSM